MVGGGLASGAVNGISQQHKTADETKIPEHPVLALSIAIERIENMN
jgi:hypothetical protein